VKKIISKIVVYGESKNLCHNRETEIENVKEAMIKISTWWSVFLEKLTVTHLVKRHPLLKNPKLHYHVQKSPSLVHILSQMHPVYPFPP
jgi:hypothetical protein